MVVVDGYEFPDDVYVSRDHLWARVEGELVTIGITDFTQKLAGNMDYVDLPDEGDKVDRDKYFSTVETGKWVGTLKAPVSGEIVEVNWDLEDQPDLLNKDAYGKGWIIRVKPSNLEEDLKTLMRGDALIEFMKKEIPLRTKK